MRTLTKKQTVIVAGVAAAALGTSGVAYAYWTTGGSGTGTAATSAGETSKLVLIDASTSTPTDMAPGVAPGGISVVVRNTSITSPYYVNSVTVSIDSITGGLGGVPACTAADYKFLDSSAATVAGTGSVVMTNGASELATDNGAVGGPDQVGFSGVKIGFADSASNNQDACKGATVNLKFVIA